LLVEDAEVLFMVFDASTGIVAVRFNVRAWAGLKGADRDRPRFLWGSEAGEPSFCGFGCSFEPSDKVFSALLTTKVAKALCSFTSSISSLPAALLAFEGVFCVLVVAVVLALSISPECSSLRKAVIVEAEHVDDVDDADDGANAALTASTCASNELIMQTRKKSLSP
jgi:hypothetical protein